MSVDTAMDEKMRAARKYLSYAESAIAEVVFGSGGDAGCRPYQTEENREAVMLIAKALDILGRSNDWGTARFLEERKIK